MGPQARGHAAGGEQVSEDSSVFTAAPHCSSYYLSSNSCQILHYGKLYSYFIYISQCNNNRNKVYNKSTVLESSRK